MYVCATFFNPKKIKIMKKLSFIFAALIMALTVSAQPEKGNIFLGGSVNLNAGSSNTKVNGDKTDGPKTFSFNVSPAVGYFLSDKIMAGIKLGYTTNSTKTTDNSDNTFTELSNTIGVGLFARYYIVPIEKMGFFFEANVGTGFGSSAVKVNGDKTDGPSTFSLNAGISPGIAIFVSNRVALEAQYGFLGYNSFSTKSDNGGVDVKQNSSNFGLNLNPGTFRFGVSVLF
jgi:hypothetical protein